MLRKRLKQLLDLAEKYDKVIFLCSALILVAILSFGVGLQSGHTRNAAFRAVYDLKQMLVQVASSLRIMGGRPYDFLQPAQGRGSGVTVNNRPDDGSLIFMAGFFENNDELRLIQRDGTLVARWPVHFSRIFPHPDHLQYPPTTDWNIDLHGALALPDGSVVFNFEYGGTVKLSRCGEVLWTLAHPTHHSLERSEKGGYWIPGRIEHAPSDKDSFPPFTTKLVGAYSEDIILHVSDEGKITDRKSVPELLYQAGLLPVLTATGEPFPAEWDKEIVHLNQISELSSQFAGEFPRFRAGDLVLSLRNYNLLLVTDPDDWSVKWWQTGPWLRQHSAMFDADGTISMFNNNVFSTAFGSGARRDVTTPVRSNILKVNPDTGQVTYVYGARPGEALASVIRGKQQPLPGGDEFITEFEGGRVFEVDSDGKIVWEYVNVYDKDNVAELTQARLYPANYFKVRDWNCPPGAE